MIADLIPSSKEDVVGVFDSSFDQVFDSARPMKCSVNESSKLMDHPIETGATITDHRVRLPVEIQISMILDPAEYQNTYQQIKEIYNRADVLTVITRTGSYENMIIASIPHDETVDMFSTVAMAITMREVRFVTPVFADIKVSSPKHGSTVKRGQQQPGAEPEATKKASILSKIKGIF